MGFSARKIFFNDCKLIPAIENDVALQLETEGFKVKKDILSSGEATIDIAKGGIIKAILGLRNTLTIRIKPEGNNIALSVGTGMWGMQLIPTIIFLFVCWPLIVFQIYGLFKQSQLTSHSVDLVGEVIQRLSMQKTDNVSKTEANDESPKFCPECGNKVEGNFCPNCGTKLNF